MEEFQYINLFPLNQMEEGTPKQTINAKDKIFNVRKLHYKHFEHDKYHKPFFSPFHHKQTSSDNTQQKGGKKGGQYNFQIAIISSAPYKQLNRRYCQLKEQVQKEKESRLKELKKKQEELMNYEAERQRLDAERERLIKKRNQIQDKLEQIRNHNEEMRAEQMQRNQEYRIMNMEYLRNMLISMRYQNGLQIDTDNMTYEELLQLEEKIGNVSKGLGVEDIKKLDKKRWGNEEQSCSICCEDMKEGEEAIGLPCKHTFHGGCIAEWLQKEKVCPNCKQQINLYN